MKSHFPKILNPFKSIAKTFKKDTTASAPSTATADLAPGSAAPTKLPGKPPRTAVVASSSGSASSPSSNTGVVTYQLTQDLLKEVMRSKTAPKGKGVPVKGIPHTDYNPEKRSIAVMDARTGKLVSAGDVDFKFSQQSMSKPTAMILAARLVGKERLESAIGFEASGKPYNVESYAPGKDGVPSNSSINMGALKVWDILTANAPEGRDPVDLYLQFMKDLTGNQNLKINEKMAKGEAEYKPPSGEDQNNIKLLKKLKKDGALESKDMQKVLENYCRACAVMVTTEDMARLTAVLANEGKDPVTGKQHFSKELAEMTVASNVISGSYDESGKMYKKSGFSGKTGVDGGHNGLLMNHRDLAFATHHQNLNGCGNSDEGQKHLIQLSRMELTPPAGPTGKAVGGTAITPGALGPSARDIDQKLQASLTDDSKAMLDQLVQQREPKKAGYYMKQARADVEARQAKARNSEYLGELKTKDGMTLYAMLQQGTHNLAKIVVSDVSPKVTEQQAEDAQKKRAQALVKDLTPAFAPETRKLGATTVDEKFVESWNAWNSVLSDDWLKDETGKPLSNLL